MKKFLTMLFAAMLFVPTFAGCGAGGEAEQGAADDTNPLGNTSDDEYAQKQEKAQSEQQQ